VHRSGRTARNGEEGWALLMLQPHESDYVNFVQVSQKVKLHEMDITNYLRPNQFQDELKSIYKLQKEDRAVFDKGARAFVSYYKAYSRYDCNLILRLKGKELKTN